MGLMCLKLFLAVAGVMQVITEGKPQAMEIHGPRNVIAGVSAVYECSAPCMGSCNYSWTVDDQSISGNTFTLTADGMSTFVSVACTVADEEQTHFDIKSILVTVMNPISVRPSEDQPVLNKHPKVGRSFKLTCVGPVPPVTIIWLKGGELLTLNSQMSLSPDNTTLSFSRLEEGHSGQYQCKVLNGSASVVSKSYKIDFGHVIVDLSGPNEAEVGFESKYTCRVQCGLDCTAQWAPLSSYPKGRLLAEGPEILWTPSEVGQKQVFTCLAVNPAAGKLGEVSKTVTVIEAQPHHHSSNAFAANPSIALAISATILMLVCVWT